MHWPYQSFQRLLTALVGVVALSTQAPALPFVGLLQPEFPSSDSVTLMAIKLGAKGDSVTGKIVDCQRLPSCVLLDPRPADCAVERACLVRGSRITLSVNKRAEDQVNQQVVGYVSGSVQLKNGAVCTLEGDVWLARVRGRKRPRGAFQGNASCPTESGVAQSSRFFFWVKGYAPTLPEW